MRHEARVRPTCSDSYLNDSYLVPHTSYLPSIENLVQHPGRLDHARAWPGEDILIHPFDLAFPADAWRRVEEGAHLRRRHFAIGIDQQVGGRGHQRLE